MTTAVASPVPVWDVINGYSAYHALRAALELGVFDLLAAGPLPVGAVADALDAADPEPVAVLLETLVALDLLDAAAEGGYALSAAAARYLVAGSPASMTTLVQHSPGPASGWAALPSSMRAGSPPAAVGSELAAFYPELAEATAPTQAAVAAAVGAELARRGSWRDGGTVLDLGCGSGAWLCALLGQVAGARGIGVELPAVVPVARRRIEAAGLKAQVTLLAGDYLQVALPCEGADVVVLAHVLRAEPHPRAIALLRRALHLAGPDGVVVVADYPRPDPGTSDPSAAARGARHELLLALTVFAATGGMGLSVAQLRSWAQAAGAQIVAALEPIPRQHVYLIRTRNERPRQ